MYIYAMHVYEGGVYIYILIYKRRKKKRGKKILLVVVLPVALVLVNVLNGYLL